MQVQMAVNQHVSQLQSLVASGQMTPQVAMMRYSAIQQAMQAYHAKRATRTTPTPVDSTPKPAAMSPPAPATPWGRPGDAALPPAGPAAVPSASVTPPVAPAAPRASSVDARASAGTPPVAPVAPAPAPSATPLPEDKPAMAPAAAPDTAAPSETPTEPIKLKIEYVPTQLYVSTCGGRDLERLDRELAPRVAARYRMRSVQELGTVDLYALSLSLRSRLDTEVSYALNTLLVLTAGIGAPAHASLSLGACDELLDDLLDLLADQLPDMPWALDDHDEALLSLDMPTYSDAADVALQDESEVRLWRRGSSSHSERGAEQQAARVQLLMTIFRNVALMGDNAAFLASHPRFLPMLAALAQAARTDPRWDEPTATSPLRALTLVELLEVLKDTLTVLLGVAGETWDLSGHAPATSAALLDVLRFFVLDAAEMERRQGAPPSVKAATLPAAPAAPAVLFPVPHHARLALQTLSVLALPDHNREALAARVPAPVLLQLAECLVGLLPVDLGDFRPLASLTRLEYTETAAFCLYHTVYLAPLSVKQQLRERPGVLGVLFRAVKQLLQSTPDYQQNPYGLLCRRLVDTLKLLGESKDLLSAPALQGMYWPPEDTDAPSTMAILSGESDAVLELLTRTAHVDTNVATDLWSLVSSQPVAQKAP